MNTWIVVQQIISRRPNDCNSDMPCKPDVYLTACPDEKSAIENMQIEYNRIVNFCGEEITLAFTEKTMAHIITADVQFEWEIRLLQIPDNQQ